MSKYNFFIYISIFIGGGLGSLTRYFFGILSKKIFHSDFPFGTFLANIISCLIVGVLLFIFKDKIQQNSWVTPIFIIGFCGGLSTFSTFSNETAQLFHQGNISWAIVNITTSIIFGVGIIYWLRFKI